ncbi:MAG TPA: PP2C family serine/threonine-protein phosphatase [Burkholderiaceae bacterium]|nr:PP2C family serine/threonine-protein phosphatase [Burkholderiaceae bacterium]
MRFTIFQDTAIGARSVNQDRMGYCFSRESLMMVVADGMGGHARGEVAAQIALQTCAGLFQRQAQPRLADPAAFLDGSLRAAHREMLRYQALHRLPDAPRTTVVACIVQDERAWWAHAGDSRLYWLRDGSIMARTRDHSKVQTLVTLGLIAPEEQEHHPERNKVLNCLGSPYEPSVEIAPPVRLARGDTLVLCSDGFWAGIPEDGFAQAFAEAPVAQVVPLLVQRAVAAQGRGADNTTAVALVWEGLADDDVPTLSSLDLPDGAVTTTISIGQLDGPVSDDGLSEEEIERQIAEIQRAIQRTNEDGSGGPT